MTAIAASHSSDAWRRGGSRWRAPARSTSAVGDHVAQQAGDDVADQHGGAADRHRAEAVHHAGDLVGADADGGARRAEHRAQHDDPGHDVVDVLAAAG